MKSNFYNHQQHKADQLFRTYSAFYNKAYSFFFASLHTRNLFYYNSLAKINPASQRDSYCKVVPFKQDLMNKHHYSHVS